MALMRTKGLLRVKGIVRFADDPGRRSIVHLVGNRFDVTDGGPWSDSEPSQLVLLGLKPVLPSFAPGGASEGRPSEAP